MNGHDFSHAHAHTHTHSCHPRRRGFWHQLLLGVSFLSLIMAACFPTAVSFRGGALLRLLFLVIYSSRLRQEVSLTLKILPQFGKALVLLLAVFLLYAVLGLSLFSPFSDDAADTQEGPSSCRPCSLAHMPCRLPRGVC